jgi:hypothetical protein
MRFYEILSEAGLAEPVEVTEAEQKAILAKTMIHYAGRGMVADLKRVKAEGSSAEEIQGEAYRLARRKALQNILIDLTHEEIQLTSYVQV